MQRIQWKRAFDRPFLSPQINTVAPSAVTTPDCLAFNGELIFYIGGVEAGNERIIQMSANHFDLEKPGTDLMPSASVALDTGPSEFDRYHVYDPATIFIDGKIYLFYSAIGKGPDSIGLAISENGREFVKMTSPIIIGRAPEIVRHLGRCYLFYVLRLPGLGYQIYSSISESCFSFQAAPTEPVLGTGPGGSWDEFEVTTPRIFDRNGVFYMTYGGCKSTNRRDMPEAFGLARSTDLIHWEKYPQNPVFSVGDPGQWDDGAIWFGTVFEHGDELNLLYEGGRINDIENNTPALTQVGLAKIGCVEFDKALIEW